MEQYTRRNSLRFYGIPENQSKGKQEDTDTVIQKVVQEKLGIKIEKADICRSHRIGGKPNSRDFPSNNNQPQPRPRPIIVKFVSYNTRRRVFMNKRKLKGQKITIREDLTKANRDVLTSAIQKYGERNTWTMDGRIYFVTGDGRKQQYGYDEHDDDELLSDFSAID